VREGSLPRVKRSLVVLLAVVAAAAGITACGDDKVKQANAYVSAVNQAQGDFASKSNELVGRITPTSSRKHDDVVLKEFYAAVDGFVHRLRAIKPPVKVKALHAKLTAALVRFGVSLRSAGGDLTSNNAGRILDGQAKLARATQSVSRSINATVAKINRVLKS
jgi:hypothetical protein